MTGPRGRFAVSESSCDDAKTIEKVSENYFEIRALFISSPEMGRALLISPSLALSPQNCKKKGKTAVRDETKFEKKKEKAAVKVGEDSFFVIAIGGMRT